MSMNDKTTHLELDPRQLAAVLAGLRLLQEDVSTKPFRNTFGPKGIGDILSDSGYLKPMNSNEIGDLAEKINIS